jgi:hypothetical protein
LRKNAATPPNEFQKREGEAHVGSHPDGEGFMNVVVSVG